jgi:two-component system nitrate/nitrite sensor histidine kinase NarX
MNPTKHTNTVSDNKRRFFNQSSSLTARAGQIIAIYIGLGLISMISSMLVAENLNGDASHINQAGALRMQAMRISRAQLELAAEQHNAKHRSLHLTEKKQQLQQEIERFEQRYNTLFSQDLKPLLTQQAIANVYQPIALQWQTIKQQAAILSPSYFDNFVHHIDQLVLQLQRASERKLSLLRLIQGLSVLSLLVVSAFVLYQLHHLIIVPINQMARMARKIAKGNFEQKIDYRQNNELGTLALAINQMSEELKQTYQHFEHRVQQKTAALTQSNESLALLYHLASKLTQQQQQPFEQHLLAQVIQLLGHGSITLKLTLPQPFYQQVNAQDDKIFDADNLEITANQFAIKKQSLIYGVLTWTHSRQYTMQAWQQHFLQAFADLIATTIELQQTRQSENRLLIMEERAVIARELHDSLAQSLSFLKVQLRLLERKLQKNMPENSINETMDELKTGLSDAYLQLRELLTTFRLKLDDPSLHSAIKGTVKEFSTKCNIPIELDWHLPENTLTANQEIHILQIIREALSNVQRHAKATAAGVSATVEPAPSSSHSLVTITIWDNGIGLPDTLAPQGHFGLGIMEERAKSLNTFIQLTPNKPQGTCVTFTITVESLC